MAKTFRFFDPAQSLILPPSLDDWLPEDHLARYVGAVIDELDLDKIMAYYEDEERGYPPYHPVMMTRIIVYGYAAGVRSSRKLEQACVDIVPFRFLAAGNLPKHSAISDFRHTHLAVLEDLFVQVLRLAKRNGFLKVGTVAIDGCKMKANAALDQNRSHEDLAKAEEQELRRIAKELLDDAERIDQAEDALYGPDRGDELPPSVRTRKERLDRIRDAKRQLEQEAATRAKEQEAKIRERAQRESEEGRKLRGRKPKAPDATPDEDAKRNTTDPDSRIMKTRTGYVQGYNAQAAADTESNLIVAADVTQECNDVHQLNPMLEQVKQNTGKRPKRGVADAGYWSEDEVKRASKRVDVFVATTKDWKQRKALQDAGPPRGRIPKGLSFKERMERKLRTKLGRAVYKLRGRTIEPRFGCIKEEQGVRGFLLRGVDGARGEWR
ncbi:MAG: IS1182 family transposase, partial [bacterium]